MAETMKDSRMCPNCGNKIEVEFQQEYEVPLFNKKVKNEIMSKRGDYFSTTCSKCGQKVMWAYPFRYVDPVQKLDFFLMPVGHPEEQKFFNNIDTFNTHVGFTTRLVADGDALAEKIIIQEAGLDDRVIELCKNLLWGDFCEEQLKYADYKMEFDLFVFSKSSEYKYVIMYAYEVNGKRETLALQLTEKYYNMIKNAFEPIYQKLPQTAFDEVNTKWAYKMYDIRRQNMKNEQK